MATPTVQFKSVSSKTFFSLFLLSLWISSLVSQNALSPDFVPSADANALGKYGYFPVSYYTGQANISIPLHSLETNGRTLDIDLDYDASGIMPDVHPGWVGQNWSLSGPGVITRSVQGQPDEEGLTQGAFYLNNRISYIQTVLELSDWFSEDSTDTYEELSNFALDRQFLYGKTVDAEPDIYNFSFLGMSGKFYLANDGTWKVISSHNLKIEFDIEDPDNYQNPLIEYVPGTSEMRKYEDVIKGFKIIDIDGYTYTFGYDTNAVEYSLPFFRQYSGPAFFGDPDWTSSAWFLTKVEDYRGTDIFVLEYERSYFTAQPFENQNSVSSGCKLANGNWLCCNQSVIKKGGGSLISPVYLTSIESNRQERVEFRTSITNQKPFSWTSIFEMESNDIIDFICPGSGGCPYTPFPFLQEEGYYSYDPSGAFPNPFNGLMWLKLDSILIFQRSTHLVKAVELQFNNDPDERLNLLEVNFIGNDLYDNPEPEEFDYSFDYNQFGSLPDYFSREIDHFGYYNGNPDGTSSSFPFYDFEGLDTTYFEARSSDEDFLMIGQLTKIHYPTGGRTEFDFEPHSYTNIVSNDRQSTYSESGIVGGLRIKEIRNYDAIIGSPATAKTYHYVQEYEAGDTTGSGILAFKPKYAWVDWLFPSEFWPDGGYRESNWSTNVLVPLGNKFESHIGYSDVAEVNQDGSYTIYSFLTHINIKDDLPYADLNLEFSPYARFSDKSHLRGKNTAIRHFGDDDELVQSIDIFYRDSSELPGFNEYAISINAGFGYNCPESNGDYFFRGNALKIFHNKHLIDSVRTRWFYDGQHVETVETSLYSKPTISFNKYAFLKEKSITNSDGSIHAEEFEYSFDHISAVMGQQTLLDAMVDDHRFARILSEKKVNDTLVDGSLNLFGNFSGIPEVNKVRRYEATWDAIGDLTGSWEDQMEITSYNTPFLLPIVTSKTGWEDEVRFWGGTGRILRKFYEDHNRYWAYHVNDQLKTFIEIDSLKKEFRHDAFSRIDTVIDLPKNIVHSYEYFFGSDPMERSYFKSKTDFPLASNSELDSIVAYTYVDGLGRPVQLVNKYASPLATADVISKTEYENTGRVYKSYEPIEVNSNDGSYYTGSFNGGFSESVYHPDPLNRISSITPPGWHSSLCSYTTNSSPVTFPDGQLFPVHSLHLKSTTDPDDHVTELATDKLGRTVYERVYGDTDTIVTWTKYDHKNRVFQIYPPGTGTSTPGLIFSFRYDGDDNLIYKKSPDSDAEEFRYDIRNLQTARRNAVLQDSSRWYVTHYDEYGRPIKRGYHNSTGEPDDAQEPTIHDLLEEYFYDGFNGSSTNSAAIYKGKLKKQRIKILEDAGANDHWTETEFFFDLYGRVVEEHIINHLDGSEERLISYDFADNLTQESHEIEGATGVMHVSEHTYDHQGRLLADIIDLDESGEKTTGNYAYNHKNELKELNLGRFATSGDHQHLQSLDYTYNQQGWLIAINDLLYDLIPVPPDLCGEDLPEGFAFDTLEMSGASTDDFDMFALGLNYDQTISGSTIPVSQNGNITTQRWWHQGRPTQTYSYQYDFLERVTRSVHGEFLGINYGKRDHYNEDFSYDVRGNILEVSRQGLVHEPHLGESCFQPQLIDSLRYLYEPGTNQLKQVIDDVPCPDFITLPPLIERDADYAANIEIRVDKTKVRCDADVVLTAGTRINILDSLLVITDCDSLPFVLVQDGSCPDNKYSEGFNQQSQSGEYTYDNGGNLSYDPNKKLTFQYNHLNLPYLIKGESDELRFHYAADGALMQKTYIRNDSVIWKLDYMRGKEYRNDTLEAVYHANGRIINDTSGWSYEYWIKDHLGNVRVTFADDNGNGIINGVERRSRNDFYSFGFEHNGTWKQLEIYKPENRFKYNGKEVTDELDLDHYLYGARWYDPVIGRFMSVDPIAGGFPHLTTYNYASNNPVLNIDLHGLQGLPFSFLSWGIRKWEKWQDNVDEGMENIMQGATESSGVINSLPVSEKSKENLHKIQMYGGYGQALSPALEMVESVTTLHPLGAAAFGTMDLSLNLNEEDYVGAGISLTLLGLNLVTGGKGGMAAKSGGLGNPFKGKTFNEIDVMFKHKGFTTKGIDPVSGKGSYLNSKTGTKYYLDQGGRTYKAGYEGPHVDIWYNGHPSYEKVKYFLDGSPKMYTPLK